MAQTLHIVDTCIFQKQLLGTLFCLLSFSIGEVSQREEATHDQLEHNAQQESFIGEWSGDESDTSGEESAPPPPQSSRGRKHHGKEEKDSAPPQVVRGTFGHIASTYIEPQIQTTQLLYCLIYTWESRWLQSNLIYLTPCLSGHSQTWVMH